MALVDALRTFMYVSLWGKPVISVARGLNGLIKSIFRSGEQGFAYDINDLSTLFQDAAGTTPVTAAGQPIGLVLDKSKGLVLGGTLQVQSVGLVPLSGTAVNNGDGTYTLSNGGYARFTYDLSSLEQSAWYQVEIEVLTSAGNYIIQWCDVSSAQRTGNGIRKTLSTRVYDNIYRFADVESIAGSSLTFRFVGVRKLAGNHAYQATSASRPLLQRNATTGAYYLAFDGTDDFLVTNSIDFTATDKVSLFAGVRKLSDAAIASFIKLGVDVPVGRFEVLLPPAISSTRYELSIDAAWAQFNFNAAPVSGVLVGFLDRSAPSSASGEISSRLNGAVNPIVVNSGTGSTGNFGNLPLYIGRRNGTSLPFNGHLYSLIGVARLTTDAETAALEKAIAKHVGVTL